MEDKSNFWLIIFIIILIVGLILFYVIDAATNKSEVDKKKRKKEILKDILFLIIPSAAVYITVTFFILVTVVQSASMEPTLMTGNTVFYNRLAYVNHEPQRGDIVTFISHESGKYMAKRIIGLPGDSIEFKDGYVVVNGQFCDETSYISDKIETNCSKTFTVPDNCYFMLGDNRENSNDSRYWDNPYISRECILGKYMGQIDFSFQYDILGKGKAE